MELKKEGNKIFTTSITHNSFGIANMLFGGAKNFVRPVHNKMREQVKEWLDESRSICPVRTGALKASLDYTEDGLMFFSVGSPLNYSLYVEYGTYKMMAQPYLRPPVIHNMQKWLNEIRDVLVKELRRSIS